MTDRDPRSAAPGTGTLDPAGGGCACACAESARIPIGRTRAGTDVWLLRHEGLTCGHCAATVATVAQHVPGVRRAHLDMRPGGVSTLIVDGNTPNAEDAAPAVTRAGDWVLR